MSIWALVALAAVAVSAEPKKDEKALNNVDVGFFLLLDKKDEPKEKALNNVDVGFFLLLDKKDQPKQAEVKALNNVDVGFFLLLDKKDKTTVSEIELGRQLFFDPRLSANKTMSCASCHNPGLAWTDGLPRARGVDGKELLRNTPTLLNVHHTQLRFFWDGRADSVEQASLEALKSRLEMNRDPRELVLDVSRIPDYARQFTALYGKDSVTADNIARAIAVFVRTEIRPAETAFERFRQDKTALSPSALRGLELFAGKGRCVQCHVGPGLSNGFFHNTGLAQAPGREDPGRWAVNQAPGSWRAFKTVPLRNVALTAPYMHDGSLATLRDVIDFYDRGGDDKAGLDPAIKPLGLTARDKEDLLAFLDALTSPQQPVAHPMLPVEAPPSRPEQAAAWAEQRLVLLEHNVARKQHDSAHANAVVLSETLAALDKLSPAACLAEPRQLASQLAFAAKAGKELKKGLKELKSSWSSCRSVIALKHAASPAGEAVPKPKRASLDEVDRVIARSEKALEELEKPRAAKCKDVDMRRLMRDLREGRRSELLREAVSGDAIEYYQYRALAASDPRLCDELAVDKVYAGLKRTGSWGCREWYWDMAVARALTTKKGDLQGLCRSSVAHDYPSLTAEDGAAICGSIARNIHDPKAMCEELAQRYLGPETLKACMNEFSRYSSEPVIGQTQDQVPELLAARYLALDRYVRAYRAKSRAHCKDSELCLALMGKADDVARQYARRVSNTVCSVESNELARDRSDDPGTLLEQGQDLLAQLDGAASPDQLGKVDERAERLARLRHRFETALEKRSGR